MSRSEPTTAQAILSLTRRGFDTLPRQLAEQARVLKQPTRARIVGAIEASPGICVRELCRRLKLGNGVVRHHLEVLEKVGLILNHREGLKRTLYPSARMPPPRVVELIPVQQAILDEIIYRPGLSHRELSRRLGLNYRTLHRHIHLLREEGLLTVEPRGGATALFAVGEWASPA